MIIRWINPPDFRNPISVSKAKKAISDYKKALGQPEGLAELTVFYCEEVFDFLAGCGMDDEGFYDALVRMFEQALKYVLALPEAQQAACLAQAEAFFRTLKYRPGYPGKGFKTLDAVRQRVSVQVDGRKVHPFSDEVGPWGKPAKGLDRRVVDAVIDHEQVAARRGGDVGVRAMHHIAVEECHRADGAGGGDDAELIGQRAQAGVVWYAHVLLLQ